MVEAFALKKGDVPQGSDRGDKLPTPDLLFKELIGLIVDPNSSSYEVISLLSEDPALSFRALKLANSSSVGDSKSITSVKQALPILGLEKIKKLVLSTRVINSYQEYQERLYRHSLACACASRVIGGYLYYHQPLRLDVLFTLGLLHDVGYLIAFSTKQIPPPDLSKPGDEAHGISRQSEKQNVEKELKHTELGGDLILGSGLSQELYQVVRYHHRPKQASSNRESVLIVHLADFLSHQLDNDHQVSYISDPEEECWTILGLKKEKLSSYISRLKENFNKSELFLRLSKLRHSKA